MGGRPCCYTRQTSEGVCNPRTRDPQVFSKESCLRNGGLLQVSWTRTPVHHPDSTTEPWGSPEHASETTVLAPQFVVQLRNPRRREGEGQLRSRGAGWAWNQVPQLCLAALQRWTPRLPPGPGVHTHGTALAAGALLGDSSEEEAPSTRPARTGQGMAGWLGCGSGRLWTRLRKLVAGVPPGRSAGGTQSPG